MPISRVMKNAMPYAPREKRKAMIFRGPCSRPIRGAIPEHKKASTAKGIHKKRFDGENHPRLQRSSTAVTAPRNGQNVVPMQNSTHELREQVPRRCDWLDNDAFMASELG